MAKPQRFTFNNVEAHALKGKSGTTIPDPIVKGLEYLKQGNRVYGRVRPMRAGKRHPKQWPIPTLAELHRQAELEGKDFPEHQACANAETILSDVRTKAQQHINAVKLGLSPAAVAMPISAGPLTLAEVAGKYLEGPGLKLTPKQQQNNRSLIENRVLPAIGHLGIADVKRLDVELLHGTMNGTPTLANRMLSLLSVIFKWAMSHGWRDSNPASGVKQYAEKKRERWLSADELARLWAVLDRYPSDPSVQAMKLLLLTGARKSEVLGAKWTEFSRLDGEEPTWTIPAIRTKTAELIVRQLDPEAAALLRSLPRSGPLLFPSPTGSGKPLRDIKRAWQRVLKEAGLDEPDKEPLVIHSLRHTVASHIVSDGGELLTAARQLGHSSIKTTQRYAHLAPGMQRQTMTAFSKKLRPASQGE